MILNSKRKKKKKKKFLFVYLFVLFFISFFYLKMNKFTHMNILIQK